MSKYYFCEKVANEGLLVILLFLNVIFVSLFYLFYVKKNVFESTDGPYPQITVHRWGREGVQRSL